MGVSEATVRYHITKLEQQGIIKGYSVVIDTTKIQLPIFVTIGVECRPAQTKRVAATMAESPYFYLVWIVTGAHNIHAKGAFPSTEMMQRIVSEIMSKTEGILGYHLSLMFEPVKDQYLLPAELFTVIKNDEA
jgi:Lrp/AsnC family transcriptional regulator for asnA, asnC and gidA